MKQFDAKLVLDVEQGRDPGLDRRADRPRPRRRRPRRAGRAPTLPGPAPAALRRARSPTSSPTPTCCPKESIRFFYVDRAWTDALVQGALSVGTVTTADRAQLEAVHQAIRDDVDDAESAGAPPAEEDLLAGVRRHDHRLPAAVPRGLGLAQPPRPRVPPGRAGGRRADDGGGVGPGAHEGPAARAARARGPARAHRRRARGRAHRGAAAGHPVRRTARPREPARRKDREGAPARQHRHPRPAEGRLHHHQLGAGAVPSRRAGVLDVRALRNAIEDEDRPEQSTRWTRRSSRWRCCASRSARCSGTPTTSTSMKFYDLDAFKATTTTMVAWKTDAGGAVTDQLRFDARRGPRGGPVQALPRPGPGVDGPRRDRDVGPVPAPRATAAGARRRAGALRPRGSRRADGPAADAAHRPTAPASTTRCRSRSTPGPRASRACTCTGRCRTRMLEGTLGELPDRTPPNRLGLPPLPDRWVVLRIVLPVGATRPVVSGWVLEADRAVAVPVAGVDRGRPGVGATGWRRDPGDQPDRHGRWLAAVVGDVRRRARTASPSTTRSTTSPTTAPDGVDGDMASYVVAGWWKDPASDPLDSARSSDSLGELLEGLRWRPMSDWGDNRYAQQQLAVQQDLRQALGLVSEDRYGAPRPPEPGGLNTPAPRAAAFKPAAAFVPQDDRAHREVGRPGRLGLRRGLADPLHREAVAPALVAAPRRRPRRPGARRRDSSTADRTRQAPRSPSASTTTTCSRRSASLPGTRPQRATRRRAAARGVHLPEARPSSVHPTVSPRSRRPSTPRPSRRVPSGEIAATDRFLQRVQGGGPPASTSAARSAADVDSRFAGSSRPADRAAGRAAPRRRSPLGFGRRPTSRSLGVAEVFERMHSKVGDVLSAVTPRDVPRPAARFTFPTDPLRRRPRRGSQPAPRRRRSRVGRRQAHLPVAAARDHRRPGPALRRRRWCRRSAAGRSRTRSCSSSGRRSSSTRTTTSG